MPRQSAHCWESLSIRRAIGDKWRHCGVQQPGVLAMWRATTTRQDLYAREEPDDGAREWEKRRRIAFVALQPRVRGADQRRGTHDARALLRKVARPAPRMGDWAASRTRSPLWASRPCPESASSCAPLMEEACIAGDLDDKSAKSGALLGIERRWNWSVGPGR